MYRLQTSIEQVGQDEERFENVVVFFFFFSFLLGMAVAVLAFMFRANDSWETLKRLLHVRNI